jgi:hypothetical protein
MLDFLLDDDSEDNAESEITAFMRERADPDTDSLAWWKDNSDKYSRLSVLARRYLAVPSTSFPSERIFSAAGTQYKLFTYQVMPCQIHDCYSVIVVQSFR